MRGPDDTRDRLTLLLASETPRKIALLRQAWRVGAEALPDVDRFVSGEMPDDVLNGGQGGVWVAVLNPRLLSLTRTGDFSAAGEPEYRTRYGCRVQIWARGQDWDKTIACRDNLVGALRLALLQYPTLTVDGGDTGYLLHEDTYTEDCGAPVRAKGSRSWAAALIGIDLDVYEHIDDGSTLPTLGTAEKVTPDAFAVGPTTALPDQ